MMRAGSDDVPAVTTVAGGVSSDALSRKRSTYAEMSILAFNHAWYVSSSFFLTLSYCVLDSLRSLGSPAHGERGTRTFRKKAPFKDKQGHEAQHDVRGMGLSGCPFSPLSRIVVAAVRNTAMLWPARHHSFTFDNDTLLSPNLTCCLFASRSTHTLIPRPSSSLMKRCTTSASSLALVTAGPQFSSIAYSGHSPESAFRRMCFTCCKQRNYLPVRRNRGSYLKALAPGCQLVNRS